MTTKGLEIYLERLRALLPPALVAADTEQLVEAVSVRGLLSEIVGALSGQGSAILSFLLLCLGSVALISAAAHAGTDASFCSLSEGICAAMMGVSVFMPLRELLQAAVSLLSEEAAFFGAAVPILQAITLAAGGVQSAAAAASGAQITLYVVEVFFCRLVLPVVSVIFALGLIATLGDGGSALSSLAGSVRRIFLWLLGLGTTLMGAALALQSVITAGADNTAMRTAKYAAAGLLPLVGGAVSASLSTLATGLSFVKTVAGASVVAALLLLSLPMLVRLLLYRLCLDASAGLAEFLGAGAAGRMLSAFRGAMDTLIAVFALSTVLFLLQCILFLCAGVAIL